MNTQEEKRKGISGEVEQTVPDDGEEGNFHLPGETFEEDTGEDGGNDPIWNKIERMENNQTDEEREADQEPTEKETQQIGRRYQYTRQAPSHTRTYSRKKPCIFQGKPIEPLMLIFILLATMAGAAVGVFGMMNPMRTQTVAYETLLMVTAAVELYQMGGVLWRILHKAVLAAHRSLFFVLWSFVLLLQGAPWMLTAPKRLVAVAGIVFLALAVMIVFGAVVMSISVVVDRSEEKLTQEALEQRFRFVGKSVLGLTGLGVFLWVLLDRSIDGIITLVVDALQQVANFLFECGGKLGSGLYDILINEQLMFSVLLVVAVVMALLLLKRENTRRVALVAALLILCVAGILVWGLYAVKTNLLELNNSLLQFVVAVVSALVVALAVIFLCWTVNKLLITRKKDKLGIMMQPFKLVVVLMVGLLLVMIASAGVLVGTSYLNTGSFYGAVARMLGMLEGKMFYRFLFWCCLVLSVLVGFITAANWKSQRKDEDARSCALLVVLIFVNFLLWKLSNGTASELAIHVSGSALLSFTLTILVYALLLVCLHRVLYFLLCAMTSGELGVRRLFAEGKDKSDKKTITERVVAVCGKAADELGKTGVNMVSGVWKTVREAALAIWETLFPGDDDLIPILAAGSKEQKRRMKQTVISGGRGHFTTSREKQKKTEKTASDEGTKRTVYADKDEPVPVEREIELKNLI